MAVDNHEWVVRALADEPRVHRRILADQLMGALAVNDTGRKFARSGLFGYRSDRGYVFLIVPKPENTSYDDYRQSRREVLMAYCHAIKLRMPNLRECIGIASEPLQSEVASQDFVRVELGEHPWTPDERKDIESLRDEFEIFNPDTMVEKHVIAYEYPSDDDREKKKQFVSVKKKRRSTKKKRKSKRKK